jgi:predicted hydrolase (HD superfamily)
MISITQYLEETLSEKSQDELMKQMSDEERLAYLKERARKEKLKRSAISAGLVGATSLGLYLHKRYR